MTDENEQMTARDESTAAEQTGAEQAPETTEQAAQPGTDAATDVNLAEATAPEPVGESKSESKPAKSGAKAAPRRGHHAGQWTGIRARYRDEVVPALHKEFNYTNPMQVPRLTKIVVNIGLGEALTNAKALDAAVGDLAQITGQKPIVTRARRSIAQFRLRTGNPIGAKVTLRGQHMWDFLERLTRLALPRIRDFRGVPSKSFDGRGNYSLGLREQLAFPEIDYDKIDRLRGLEVSIVTTAETDEESKRLLQLLGMPFAN